MSGAMRDEGAGGELPSGKAGLAVMGCVINPLSGRVPDPVWISFVVCLWH